MEIVPLKTIRLLILHHLVDDETHQVNFHLIFESFRPFLFIARSRNVKKGTIKKEIGEERSKIFQR